MPACLTLAALSLAGIPAAVETMLARRPSLTLLALSACLFLLAALVERVANRGLRPGSAIHTGPYIHTGADTGTDTDTATGTGTRAALAGPAALSGRREPSA